LRKPSAAVPSLGKPESGKEGPGDPGGSPEETRYRWDVDRPRSIGRVHGWNGNFGILVRAFAYLLANGGDGLRERLSAAYQLGYPSRPVMHEFVLSARRQKSQGRAASTSPRG
jgi:glycine cleavage system protein P-like pyridoxal-binding family